MIDVHQADDMTSEVQAMSDKAMVNALRNSERGGAMLDEVAARIESAMRAGVTDEIVLGKLALEEADHQIERMIASGV